MSIPRSLDPDTGVRPLPDFTRSEDTVQRMIAALESSRRRPAPDRDAGAGDPSVHRRTAGVTFQARTRHPDRSAVLRASLSAFLLASSLLGAVLAVRMYNVIAPGDHAPSLFGVAVLVSLGALVVTAGLMGARCALTALAAARSRVDVSDDGIVVIGALRTRSVAWTEIASIDSRRVHPVHGLTAALVLKDGRAVVMPPFDRPLWMWSRPSTMEVRTLRKQLSRHTRGARSHASPRRSSK